MKLRYIFLLFLWISFLGCGHSFQNQSLPQAHRGQTTASPTTAFSKHTPNTIDRHSPSDHTRQMVLRILVYKIKNSNQLN